MTFQRRWRPLSKRDLLIPQKIKVGYQDRSGTYTGRLAYVIYYDQKGKLRKEASWQNWRDKQIEPDDFENIPTEGFVLNKKVGGYAGDWGSFRQAYVRVYDPRGFEFEITVPNLLYILENTSSIKGKGLEGEFVYAWDGTDLVLLPTVAPDYIELTKLNHQRFKAEPIKARDLKIGATYLHTSNVEWVYMGRFDYYEAGYQCRDKWFSSGSKARKYAKEQGFMRTERNWYGQYETKDVQYGVVGSNSKRHCFYNRGSGAFHWPKSLSGLLIDIIHEDPAADYADLFEQLESTTKYSPYDETKDVRAAATLEEVRAHVHEWWWSWFLTDQGELRIRKSGSDGLELYLCDFQHDDGNRRLATFFPCTKTLGKDLLGNVAMYEMIPVPLEDIYEKFHFDCTRQYLADGKYYRTVFQ